MHLAVPFTTVGRTPIINVFMFSVVGYYIIGTTLKDKFSVVFVFVADRSTTTEVRRKLNLCP